jgi:hypothetical protein
VPKRSRAFALTALVTEKTCFFGLDLLMGAALLRNVQRNAPGACG